jgi:hypothetical protein
LRFVQPINSQEIWPIRSRHFRPISPSEARKKNQSESRIQKETTNRLHRYKVFILKKAETREQRLTLHSRKSKAKDQTKALKYDQSTQVVDDLISRAKDEKPVDWRNHLGENVYVIMKAPQLTIHIRKHFVPNGEWTLHPTKIGMTLSLWKWKELKKTIPLFEDREPELRTTDNKVTGED